MSAADTLHFLHYFVFCHMFIQQVVGVMAQEMSHATAVAVNHKYALMAFGSEK